MLVRAGEDRVGVGDTAGLGEGVAIRGLVAVGLGLEVAIGTVASVCDLTIGDGCAQATRAIAAANEIMLAFFAMLCT